MKLDSLGLYKILPIIIVITDIFGHQLVAEGDIAIDFWIINSWNKYYIFINSLSDPISLKVYSLLSPLVVSEFNFNYSKLILYFSFIEHKKIDCQILHLLGRLLQCLKLEFNFRGREYF